MPIKVKNDLPVRDILEKENIFVVDENRAMHQDIRSLQICILNLMPLKEDTELHLLRSMSNTPLQIDVSFMQMSSHHSNNTSPNHLNRFYNTFDELKDNTYDGLIITGAPVEQMDFEEVDYWPELCRVFEWSKTNVTSTFHICWGAQAGLYYHYNINKQILPKKVSGVFSHRMIKPRIPFFRGFDDEFWIPHSRNTSVLEEDILKVPELELLAVSDEAGVFAVKSADNKRFFIMGHPEYDADTLANEYYRDLDKGIDPEIPAHYFPGDDPTKKPVVNWRSHAQLLYTNWLNYYVYQTTPYDIRKIAAEKKR